MQTEVAFAVFPYNNSSSSSSLQNPLLNLPSYLLFRIYKAGCVVVVRTVCGDVHTERKVAYDLGIFYAENYGLYVFEARKRNKILD